MEQSYNQQLPDITVGTKVAIQDQCTKRWDIYGTVTNIGPNRRYFIKTLSGRVLVRNRRFLRKRLPISLVPHTNRPSPSDLTPLAPMPIPSPTSVPRRSSRARVPTKRLIEEMTIFQVDNNTAPKGARGM